MKIFVAGASGALGKRLVPILVASGHEVVAMTRSRGKEGACARWAPSRSWPTASIGPRS